MATIYCAKLNCSWNNPEEGECNRDSLFVNVLGQCQSIIPCFPEDKDGSESQRANEHD